ncbi:hypothetical protein CY34DRAFT_802861 [Suillus luteus UH-Slu-Lm8-n1]|uniref:Uncharacterized protein n=1 Tax=Suillus luteus UH-Slu-Lm8-n1 TaxID=930992 RepID=A0A0D0BLT2_9AGAM|nr:hypothetical protein CY34DRAFT_802861 [Suillus luteus UH-Slu-Lm8-n1]
MIHDGHNLARNKSNKLNGRLRADEIGIGMHRRNTVTARWAENRDWFERCDYRPIQNQARKTDIQQRTTKP